MYSMEHSAGHYPSSFYTRSGSTDYARYGSPLVNNRENTGPPSSYEISMDPVLRGRDYFARARSTAYHQGTLQHSDSRNSTPYLYQTTSPVAVSEYNISSYGVSEAHPYNRISGYRFRDYADDSREDLRSSDSGYDGSPQDSEITGKKKRHICTYAGCDSAFARKADRDRHITCVHEKAKIYPCRYKKCSRKGENGFTRKDHLTEHERNYHKKDVPKRRWRRSDEDDDVEEEYEEEFMGQIGHPFDRSFARGYYQPGQDWFSQETASLGTVRLLQKDIPDNSDAMLDTASDVTMEDDTDQYPEEATPIKMEDVSSDELPNVSDGTVILTTEASHPSEAPATARSASNPPSNSSLRAEDSIGTAASQSFFARTWPAMLTPSSSAESDMSFMSESGASDMISDITDESPTPSMGPAAPQRLIMNAWVGHVIRIFGHEVIRCVMRDVHNWYPAGVRTCTEGSNSSGSNNTGVSRASSGTTQTPSPSKNRSSRKTNSTSPTDEDENDGDGDGYSHPEQSKSNPISKQSKTRFACPFYKNDPVKHRRWKSCRERGFDTVHRTKEHIYRRHAKPIHCPRCGDIFDTDEALGKHLTKLELCQVKENEVVLVDGITKEQEKSLKSRKRPRGQTEADRWRDMYRILFCCDDEPVIPSPYWQPDDSKTQEIVTSCSEYFREQLPKRIRLDMQSSFEMLPDWLKRSMETELDGIVQKRTDEVALLYRNNLISPPPSPRPVANQPNHQASAMAAIASGRTDDSQDPPSLYAYGNASTETVTPHMLSRTPPSQMMSNTNPFWNVEEAEADEEEIDNPSIPDTMAIGNSYGKVDFDNLFTWPLLIPSEWDPASVPS